MNLPIRSKRRWRIIGSLLILAHLTAVFAPPLAFQSRGPRGLSPSVAMVSETLAGYGQLLYLDRGYAFFAPDPGPSHLIRVRPVAAENTGAEGEAPAEGDTAAGERFYPDLGQHWPRLLYHRHFMLAEFLNDAYQPQLPREAASLIGPDLTLDELQAWRTGRKRYEAIADSMVAHVGMRTNRAVRIDRIEHVIPDFVGFAAAGVPLNAPPSYIELPDIPITLETLLGARAQSLPQPDGPLPVEVSEPVPAPTGEPLRGGEAASEEPSTAPEKPAEPEPSDEPELSDEPEPSSEPELTEQSGGTESARGLP